MRIPEKKNLEKRLDKFLKFYLKNSRCEKSLEKCLKEPPNNILKESLEKCFEEFPREFKKNNLEKISDDSLGNYSKEYLNQILRNLEFVMSPMEGLQVEFMDQFL